MLSVKGKGNGIGSGERGEKCEFYEDKCESICYFSSRSMLSTSLFASSVLNFDFNICVSYVDGCGTFPE